MTDDNQLVACQRSFIRVPLVFIRQLPMITVLGGNLEA